jgi:hypothetical protein
MKFQKRDIPTGDGKGGLFLKFKDGESKVGVLRGECYEFYQVWENGKSQVVPEDHPGAKSRFRANFITKEDGELKARIFEFGLTVYNALADISESYDLEQTAVKITRRGTGTDTIYMILPVPPKEQPNAAQLKTIQALPLNILEHKEQPAKPKAVPNLAPQATGTDDSEGLPF